MGKLFYFLLLIILLCSCRKYEYTLIEKVPYGDNELVSSDSESIYASSDSAAFEEAYKKICIATFSYEESSENHPEYIRTLRIPHSFTLVDSDGENVVDRLADPVKNRIIAHQDQIIGYMRDNHKLEMK